MNKKAFTLIELLVVIAIIALLLATVLPALRSAKVQAKQVYCKNNLKQMAQAAFVYTADHEDYFPIAHYTASITNMSELPVNAAPQQDGAKLTVRFAWDFTVTESGGRTEIDPGILWQGDTTEKIQQCPSYKGGDNWSGVAYTGYNYNTSYIGHGQSESVSYDYSGQMRRSSGDLSETIVLPAKIHHVQNTARCILFGDGHYTGGANKLMRSPMTWKGDADWSLRTGGTQGFRHRGQTNTVWVDGHVDSQSDCYTDTHPKYKPQLDQFNESNEYKIGFLSPDNSLYDLK